MAKKKWMPTNKLPMTCLIPIVDLDKTGTQVRAEHDEEVIASYAELMRDGVAFPPVEVVWDGENPILADGFHRTEATLRAGFTTIQAKVREGNRRDAVLLAMDFNANRGLNFSAASKRKCINLLLDDKEWSQWSDREVARRVGCHHQLVSKIRGERTKTMDDSSIVSERKFTTSTGKTATRKVESKPTKPSDITAEKPKAKELPPDDESRFDYVGQEIPAHLEESFDLADRFACLVDTVSEVKSEAKSMAELNGGEILASRMSQIKSQTSELYRAIKEAEPFAVCMKCAGDLKKATTVCQPCKGRGWVTREQFDMFPESVRKSVPKPPKERK